MDPKEHTEFEKRLYRFLEKEGFVIDTISGSFRGKREYSIFIRQVRVMGK